MTGYKSMMNGKSFEELLNLTKTFSDLEFKECPEMRGFCAKVQARMTFDNGWGVSVVSHTNHDGMHGVYGYVDEDTYELAVIGPAGNLHYVNPVAQGDVRGWISSAEVTKCMEEVQSFTRDQGSYPPKQWKDLWDRHCHEDYLDD